MSIQVMLRQALAGSSHYMGNPFLHSCYNPSGKLTYHFDFVPNFQPSFKIKANSDPRHLEEILPKRTFFIHVW